MTSPEEFDLPKEPDREDENHEQGAEERNLEEREVEVRGVYEPSDQAPVPSNPFVLLRDARSRCVLIWVGRFEAISISMALEGQSADRPLTHDLLKNLIERLGGVMDRVVIDDLWGDTFYAKIWLNVNGKPLPVDSRPSDAIALALRAKAPVFMTEAVLEDAGRPCDEIEGAE